MKNKEPLNIVIFRNNLRVHDNYPLFFVTKEKKRVLALYTSEIINEKNFFQRQFIYESLENLKSNLLNFEINLSLVTNIKNSLDELSKEYELKIFFEEEAGVYEKKFEEILKKYPYKSFYAQTMIEPFDFDFRKSFSHFRKKAEKIEIKSVLEKPSKVQTVNFESENLKTFNSELIFSGGEDEAIKRLEYYLDFIHSYKDTRDRVDGIDNSTKFSPYLALGCISPRMIYHKIKEKEKQTYESNSSYWIYFELLWRDFFHLVLKQSNHSLFLSKGLKNQKFSYFEKDKNYQNFFQGKTGVDLIDASIKELKTTGWLSNRNRQLIASFYIKNLGYNWLNCAKFFEDYLIDYNPASNYGNFAYQAFVGNDSSYRVFDIYKQSNLYGGKEYVKKWLNKEETQNIDLNKMVSKVKKEVYNLGE